ncbi:cadherin-15 isoform X1 [Opisthocomus hoazin]|uniref:cadherin-15 isoform X1 n=1 Tax=Opisthocomus hoazin TaxID=30419 RepID=UPI003F53114C
MGPPLLLACLLAPLCARGASPAQPGAAAPGSPPAWRQQGGLRRVKRAWVIPPISVSENHKRIPHLLVQIKSDKQQPGGVIYSIKGPGVDEEPLGVFSIDKFTGKVFLNAMLDREENDRYRLKAFALDLGGATLEDPTDLEIIVVDQNDNRPLFRQDVFTGRVVEGAEPGTCVLTVDATDADDPDTDNAVLRYSILEQGAAAMFGINATTGEICTARPGLDREMVGVYNLTVQAADMSGDGLTTTATAVIYLEDVNDNPPEFTKEEFSLEVEEQAVGVEVGKVFVHDKDLAGSPNWLAKFTILEGDPEGAFAIRTDPYTNDGVLSVAKPLDHEARDRFELTVSVRNERPLEPAAPASPRALATVRVRVRDVNEAPVFRENPRRVSVLEGTPPGTPVTTYTASDPDTRQLQTLTYALLYDPAGWLQLDPRAGVVRTKRELLHPSAFLQGGWYIALVLARDDAEPPLSATGTLSIEILEVNDHAPLLQPPAGGVVCGRPGRGGTLLLGATDDDRPPHAAPFHFHLSPQHPQLTRNWSIARFNVTHAVLAVLAELPEGPYSLPLLLRDSGTPPREREQLLNLSVCRCGHDGTCEDGVLATATAGAGITLGALTIILGSVLLLLALAGLGAARVRGRRRALRQGLLRRSRDDIRDNILNYDEQGGGEEDQDAYDINQLRHPELFPPRAKPPVRRDTPLSAAAPPAPRKLPSSPSDIEDFINEGLEAADRDPGVPPYDTALIYDYEGSGSVASPLSSIVSSLTDEDQDYDYLSEWGPRFRRLADLYGH